MDGEMMTGNLAAAWGGRLADVDYVQAFPITPQTEIIEALAKWCENGKMAARVVTMDSEHSMMTAAGAAGATGVRVFSATSSQGLLHAFELLYSVSGWRVPLVLVNVSRALAAPITLEPDDNDVLAARDSGFLQIHAETCQEVLDSILMAYRIAEDERVMLPVIVNLDGFYLSFTREPVSIPDAGQVREFLPPFRPAHLGFRASAPHALGTAVLGGSIYSYFRHQIHLASMNALEAHEEAALEFDRLFGRRYGVVEGYRLEDAEDVLVMTNAFASKGKAAVDAAREEGRRVGLLRLRMIRPWPADAIRRALLAGGLWQSWIRISRQVRVGFSFKKSALVSIMNRCGRGRSAPLSEAWEERIFLRESFAPSLSRRQKPESVAKESVQCCAIQKPSTPK